MARPKDPRALTLINVRLALREGEDDDLIALLLDCPNRALLVKRALRGADVGEIEVEEAEDLDDLLDELAF